MNNFVFQNPTKLVFGKGEIAQLATLIPEEKKILVTFGGGSVKRNSVYDQVAQALKNHKFIEFWGIEPNPEVETIRKAVALGTEHQVDFVLAVGGGSVLDGSKLIASALANPDKDPWSIVLGRYSETAIPYASVMTLPATGSEMNAGAVISRRETKEKYAFYTNYPVFSILDPEVTFSLPAFQVACGIADIFVHITEQYMTAPGQSRPMDRWAEGLLLTLLEIAPKIKENQNDYDVMADYMLTATLGLNGMISMGVSQDWCTHMIGHELTALHGVTHGASLAIVYPGTLRTLKEQKKGKILQYGERVFGITSGSEDERIEAAIAKTEEFFRSLGLATRLSEVNIGDETINLIAERFNTAGLAIGEQLNVTGDVAKQILLNCK